MLSNKHIYIEIFYLTLLQDEDEDDSDEDGTPLKRRRTEDSVMFETQNNCSSIWKTLKNSAVLAMFCSPYM